MKIITIATMKGGAGKTTLVFNLGGLLAEKYKVLMIDLDAQGSLTGRLGIAPAVKAELSVRDIFVLRTNDDGDIIPVNPESLIVKSPISELPLLDIIPAHKDLDNTEIELQSRMNREMILGYYLKANADYFDQYDYILIDTRPTFGILNRNAFLVADEIVTVTDMGQDSIDGCKDIMDKWKRALAGSGWENQIHALVMNRYDYTTMSRNLLAWVTKGSKQWVSLSCKTPIRQTVRLREAAQANLPIHLVAKHPEIVEYDNAAKGAIADINLVMNELFEKGVL